MPRKKYVHKRTKRSKSQRLAYAKKRLLTEKLVNTSSDPTSNEDPTSSDAVFDQLLCDRSNFIQVRPQNQNDDNNANNDMTSSDEGDTDFILPELLIEPCQEPEPEIDGRRIVDIKHVLIQLKNLSTHHKKCTMGEYKFNREVVSGLFSKFIYYCDNCETEVAVTSQPEEKRQEVNDSAVWGALSIGIGHLQMQELFGVMDIPVMGPKKFKLHEKRIGKVWKETLIEKMEENAKEERRIAVEKNNFLNGVPYITVLGDGGWAKRSYGHGMNSLSGVGVIIGAETKKLLYLGVRNKFCYVCTKYKNLEKEPPVHECFFNYNGPSTGMESDIIVEGFKRSEEDYGLIYKYYIGDGDSSVFPHIQERCRYGRYVKKIECANHVTRALNDHLHKLAANTSFPLESRKLLSSTAEGDTITRLERIVKGVRTAIKEAGTTKSEADVIGLRHDIRNSVDHVFGNHSHCRGSFCKRKGEASLINSLEPNFLTEIRKLVGRVEAKAEGLVFNQTTNRAEQYMSLVAKFTGGKRLNLSSRGSYTYRCFGAGLSHTKGPSWHLSPLKKLTKKSPGRITKLVTLSRERQRLKRRLTYSEKGAQKKKLKVGGHYDAEYGPLVVEPDVEEEVLEERKSQILGRLASDNVQEIERLTVGQHINPLWQEKRMNRLTASKFGVVAKRQAHTSCHNLVKNILYPRDLKSQSILFGRVNEPIAIERYQALSKNNVTQCGLFIDEEFPYLGASPDGLVGEDGLIEVKCLPSVQETTLEETVKKSKIKDFCLEVSDNHVRLKKTHNYYYQVQGQLHITNRQWCDFVVYTMTAPLFIQRIDREDDFWTKRICPKVTQFYLECILPEIADSRILRGLKARDPIYILEAQEKRLKNTEKKKNNEVEKL